MKIEVLERLKSAMSQDDGVTEVIYLYSRMAKGLPMRGEEPAITSAFSYSTRLDVSIYFLHPPR